MSSKQILHFKVHLFCALHQAYNILWQDCSKESHVFWWGNKKLEATFRIYENFEYIIVNVNKIIQTNTIILMNCSLTRNAYILQVLMVLEIRLGTYCSERPSKLNCQFIFCRPLKNPLWIKTGYVNI